MSDFPEKYNKILNKFAGEFLDAANGKSDDDLRKEILKAEGSIYEIEQQRDSDIKLSGAKDLVKELSAPYKESKNIENAKIKYCIHLLESRGVQIHKN